MGLLDEKGTLGCEDDDVIDGLAPDMRFLTKLNAVAHAKIVAEVESALECGA